MPAQDPAPSGRSDDWTAIGAARFVSLTTYRRSGDPVATPVWIAPEGDALVVTSEAATGKVRRLRHDPRVRLRPSDRFGKVDPAAITVDAHAVVIGPDREHPGATAALRAKYGVQVPLVLGFERLVRRIQRRSPDRVILRITPGGPTG